MMGLTRKHRDCYELIKRYIAEKGVPPSFDEMKDGLGLKSKSGIHRIISSLEERGLIRRLHNRARAIEIIDPGKNFLSFVEPSALARVHEIARIRSITPESLVSEIVLEWAAREAGRERYRTTHAEPIADKVDAMVEAAR